MRGIFVESLYLSSAILLFDLSVDTADFPTAVQFGIVFDDVELGFELGEYEHFVAFGEEGGEEAVEEKHLAGFGYERTVGGFGGLPGPVEIVRAVAD